MNQNDKERFANIMATLGEAFSQDVSKQKAEIYFKVLEDLEIADIEKACWRLISNRTTATFPKVGEIRAYICGDSEDQVTVALSKIEQAIRDHGYYTSVVFDDPMIHLVIARAGGWEKISSYTDEEWVWVRKDLEKMYTAFSHSPEAKNWDIPKRLAGFHERVNFGAAHQNEPFPMAYIGDEKKCLALYGKQKVPLLVERNIDYEKEIESYRERAKKVGETDIPVDKSIESPPHVGETVRDILKSIKEKSKKSENKE